MQYLITAFDGEGMLDRRMEVRPRHLENMKNVSVICAGGILDKKGGMIGSALVVEFETPEKLEHYLASEPYIVEGVWEKVDVKPMNVVIVNNEKTGN